MSKGEVTIVTGEMLLLALMLDATREQQAE
jgi:hypothetical protein